MFFIWKDDYYYTEGEYVSGIYHMVFIIQLSTIVFHFKRFNHTYCVLKLPWINCLSECNIFVYWFLLSLIYLVYYMYIIICKKTAKFDQKWRKLAKSKPFDEIFWFFLFLLLSRNEKKKPFWYDVLNDVYCLLLIWCWAANNWFLHL